MNPKIIALLMASALFAGCGHKQTETKGPDNRAPVVVSEQTIEPQTVTTSETITGTVVARDRADIGAKVMGQVKSVFVVPGQEVTAGQELVELHAPEIQARVAQAKARLARAAIDYRRTKELLAGNSATQQQFDTVESEYHAAQAGVTEAETFLSYTTVRAPFDAVVVEKDVEPGDLAMPGNRLVVLDSRGHLQFVVHIPEAMSGAVQKGQTLPVSLESISKPVEASVTEITPSADPTTRTVRVKLNLPSSPGLQPGQFGYLALPKKDTGVIVVPADLVTRKGQLEYVFVIESGHAWLRLIKTGRTFGNDIEVIAGLQPGDSIATHPAQPLEDGIPVKTRS